MDWLIGLLKSFKAFNLLLLLYWFDYHQDNLPHKIKMNKNVNFISLCSYFAKQNIISGLCSNLLCDVLCLQETHRGASIHLPALIPGMVLAVEIPHRQYCERRYRDRSHYDVRWHCGSPHCFLSKCCIWVYACVKSLWIFFEKSSRSTLPWFSCLFLYACEIWTVCRWHAK